MSLAKKKYIESSKKRLQEKLGSIQEQADFVLSYVNGVVKKAENSCNELMAITNKAQFLEKFIPVMNKLEEYHNLLYLLNATVPDEDDAMPNLDSDDSDDDDDDDDDEGKNQREKAKHNSYSAKSEGKSTPKTSQKSKNAGSGNRKSKERGSSSKTQDAHEDAVSKSRSEVETVETDEIDASESLRSSESGRQKGKIDKSATKVASEDSKSEVSKPELAVAHAEPQELQDLPRVEQNSNVGSQGNPVQQHGPPMGPVGELPLCSLTQVLQLLMTNPALAAAYCQSGGSVDMAALLAQSQGNTAAEFKEAAQMPDSQPDVTCKEPKNESVFKLPLTRENVAKISAKRQVAETMEEEMSGSPAQGGGSVVISEGDGLRVVESCDVSIAETGSSGLLSSDRKKSRHPTRRKLLKRQKPESSKFSEVDGAGSSKSHSETAASAVGPGATDLSLLSDDYGDGPSVTTLNLSEGKLTEAYVIDVTSPWLFWLQPASHKLKRLMAELNQYEDLLTPGIPAARSPPKLRAGMVVCAQYSHDLHWYRALVVSVQQIGLENQLEVLYLDYGNREFLPSSQIRPLMPQFAELPCQAFPVGLSEVAPADGSTDWSPGTTSFVASLAGTVVSTLVKTIDQCPVVIVEVFKQTSTSSHKMADYFSFAQRLIQNNLAIQASNERIVEYYRRLKRKDAEKAKDPSVTSRMNEYNLLICACPEVKPRKREKVVVPAESRETLASKMKSQEKSEKSLEKSEKWAKSEINTEMSDMGKKTSVSRCLYSPDEEDVVDDDLDSLLDLELGKRTGSETPSTSGSSKHRVGHMEKSPKPESISISSVTTEPIGQTSMKARSRLHRPTDNKTDDHKSDRQSDRTSSKGNWTWDKGNKESKSSAFENAPLKENEAAAHDKNAVRLSDVKGKNKTASPEKIQLTPVKQKPTLSGTTPTAAEVDKAKSKSPHKKSRSKSKRAPIEGSLDDKQSQVKEVKNSSKEQMKSPTNALKVIIKKEDAVAHLKEAQDESANPSCRYLSDARSDISNGSGIIKDDSSVDSPPVSPHNKQLSWEDFLHAGVKGYPPVEVQAPEDGFIVCLMSSIISPSQFYVHLADKGCATAVDQLFKEINDYFKEHNVVALQKFFEPVLFHRCVARFKEDNMLYRAKIIQVADGPLPNKFRVFFVDYGNVEWVDKDEIYPLPPKFTTIAPLAVCCMLPEVRPKQGSTPLDSESGGWSSEAIDQFKFLTGYTTPLQLHILLFHDEVISVHEEAPLGVKLTNVEGDQDVWIAHELVNGEFADPTDFFGISNKSIREYHISNEAVKVKVNEKDMVIDAAMADQEDLKDWKPMQEDFTSIRNSYKVDIQDPGVALMGYTPQDEQNVCKYFNMNRPCPRGEFCPFLHVKTEGVMTTDKVEVFAISDGEQNLVAPEAGSWVVVEVTAVYNPSHFYVSFPYGPKAVANVLDDASQDEGYADSADEETFASLKESMSEVYSKIRFRDIDMTVLANGEIVAAKFLPDNQWYRARVIDTEPSKYRVKVFYLDFGNCEWLDERETRQMQNRFMHLPFQAMECHMSLEPARKEKWGQEATDYFYDLVDGKDFYAEIKESFNNSVLTVELWHTVDKNENVADLIVKKGYGRRPIRKKSQKTQESKAKKNGSPANRYRPG